MNNQQQQTIDNSKNTTTIRINIGTTRNTQNRQPANKHIQHELDKQHKNLFNTQARQQNNTRNKNNKENNTITTHTKRNKQKPDNKRIRQQKQQHIDSNTKR